MHGGTTTYDILQKVEVAGQLARSNQAKYGNKIDTVLFFDEANTTDAIGLIKEIMCDGTIHGESLPNLHGLKIIAACNPYRKLVHSKYIDSSPYELCLQSLIISYIYTHHCTYIFHYTYIWC